MYATITVIVDGTLEEEATFTDDLLLREYLRDLADDAASHGYPTEVYVLTHEHANDGRECECIQYAQDHQPVHTFNVAE